MTASSPSCFRRPDTFFFSSEAVALDPSNDRFVALMLSYRASSFQKQREEAVEAADSVVRARKEVSSQSL